MATTSTLQDAGGHRRLGQWTGGIRGWNGVAMVFQRAYVQAMRLVPGYRWWRPLLALILAAVFIILFLILFQLPFVLYFLHIRYSGAPDAIGIQETLDGLVAGGYKGFLASNPTSILLLEGSIVLLIPAIALALRLAGLRGLGTLSSVDGHLRWNRLGSYLVPAFGLVFAIGFALPWVLQQAGSATWELPHPRIVPVALMAILVLVPLQSAAEEYAFRGLLQQVPGSWISAVWVPVLIQSLLFAAGHRYNFAGQLGIACMGLAMGVLTIRLGGLEATIAFHVANNLLSLLSSSLFTDGAVSSTVDTMELLVSVAISLVYAWVALAIAKRRGWLASDPPDLDEQFALASGQLGQVTDGSTAPPDSGEGLSGRGGAKVGWDVSQPPRSSGMDPQSLTTPPDPSGTDVPDVAADIGPHQDL